MSSRPARRLPAVLCISLLASLPSSCDFGPRNATTEMTVLLEAGYAGAWPAGLDPATNTTARANLSMMNAIYGGLFQLTADDDGSNPRVVGVLATSFEVDDETNTVIINLRRNVVFSDGSPFDAQAVKFNIERSLQSTCTCSPREWPWDPEEPITTPDEYTVALHFTRPYGAVINAFPVENVNWIASPSALRELGEDAFRILPVGAGPFRVVSNRLSSRLVLERNPLYWNQDRPYLDRLVFQSIGNEQAAYQALLAGDADVFEGMSSTPLIRRALQDSRLVVTLQPATAPYVIQLNTFRAPFDDQRAREAIYYATDVEAIRGGLFDNWYPTTQSFTGPGGLFHHEKIPDYKTYDPDAARSLVTDLGGLRVTLGTIRSFVPEQVITALQSQWESVGIEVEIATFELATLIEEFRSESWQAMLQTAGSYDPEAGAGVTFRFRSDRPNTGVKDATLDEILINAAATFDPAERNRLYLAAGRHISDNAYAPFLFAFAPAQITRRGVVGPGLTTRIPPIVINTGVLWQDVRVEDRRE